MTSPFYFYFLFLQGGGNSEGQSDLPGVKITIIGAGDSGIIMGMSKEGKIKRGTSKNQ